MYNLRDNGELCIICEMVTKFVKFARWRRNLLNFRDGGEKLKMCEVVVYTDSREIKSCEVKPHAV